MARADRPAGRRWGSCATCGRRSRGRGRGSTAGDAGGTGAGAALPALRVFIDELVPGRDAGRNEAVESERGRLAADLHAEVLPSLRRALAQAEAGGTVERLAIDLRAAVDEVESMLLARRSIVLEEMGLLAGLEWLAERVEDRSDVRVEITVDGGGEADAPVAGAGPGSDAALAAVATADRPPREAERAAFRVAQLALDNVVRHAPASTARVSVAVGPRLIRLRVEDDADSAPIDEAAAARSRPARDRRHARGGRRVPGRARGLARRGRPRHGDRLPLARVAPNPQSGGRVASRLVACQSSERPEDRASRASPGAEARRHAWTDCSDGHRARSRSKRWPPG